MTKSSLSIVMASYFRCEICNCKLKQMLTHGSLCFTPCTGWPSSHRREADIVVGSVLGRRVRHWGVAGAGLWLWGGALSLGLPSSTTCSTWLPRGETAGTCVRLPTSRMLGRRRRPRRGAHGRKGRGGSGRGGRFAGEAGTSWGKGHTDYGTDVLVKMTKTWEKFHWLTSKASPQVAYVSERVQGVWLGLVGGGAVDWARGAGSGWPTAHTEAYSCKCRRKKNSYWYIG